MSYHTETYPTSGLDTDREPNAGGTPAQGGDGTMTPEEATRILARRFGTTVELAEKLAAPVLDALEEGIVDAKDAEWFAARERRYRLAWKSACRRGQILTMAFEQAIAREQDLVEAEFREGQALIEAEIRRSRRYELAWKSARRRAAKHKRGIWWWRKHSLRMVRGEHQS